MVLIITCEHAHNKIPKELTPLFKNVDLNSHKAVDIGAFELAKKISAKCHSSLFYGKISRLVVELNRSLKIFSKKLDPKLQQELLDKYYYPYRQDVIDLIDILVLEKVQVFHFSVHTFTPVLNGEKRDCDIGLLYDPSRIVEKNFCDDLKESLLMENDQLKIRFNYPYKGISDGFTTFLRKRYKGSRYAGIELEVNQKFPLGDKKVWLNLQKSIVASLKTLFP